MSCECGRGICIGCEQICHYFAYEIRWGCYLFRIPGRWADVTMPMAPRLFSVGRNHLLCVTVSNSNLKGA